MAHVRVSEGLLEGELLRGALGRDYYSFKGIPYARPPLGDLRFQAPQPTFPWKGVRNAKKHGPVCHQYDMFLDKLLTGSEDCLYLNVYTPNLKPTKPLAVMVWIHGGGFTCGSGDSDLYGPDFLIEQDVVVVTINYRLEVLGFLCLDIPEAPGNAGMKDQVAALRWVHKNIKYFCGDPDNVTIFGESAGGASVSYHLYSPMSKGLFKRAIIQSGTINCYWSQSFGHRERALALARQLGYNGQNDMKEIYIFLKNVPFESLVRVKVPITISESMHTDLPLYFNVVNEKMYPNRERFFYGDVYERMREGIHEDVEVMIGYTADEGILNLDRLQKEDIDAKLNKYLECFTPAVIRRHCNIRDQLQAGREMKSYYFGNSKVNTDNALKMLDYFNMNMFVYGIAEWLKFHAKRETSKTYLYKFFCHSERNTFAQLWDASKFVEIDKPVVAHADDLAYLFATPILPVNVHSKSYNMIKQMTQLWTNFAKFGDPTVDNSLDVKWLPYTMEREDYLEIGEKLIPGNSPDKEEITFWETIFYKYLPFSKP
ncbi:Esterase FE4 [Eumeta japonica]|uniref:Acetylcholinesterase n=1 Tax=Eumeta variegata TaxID=151549 RepID=A0A4C1WJ16_EUMVA|nr:Esterase FE4 [Eumeta japonica]